ncbi:MAG: GNAT family N-acetyltransferase [Oscillospiraceae bacterium]|nr:GNAT family N-acetyltransferase [Oscillospiraceae bacterium]
MSHRIRHNVAAARRLGDSALIIQHDLNGEALLSQIATLPSSQNRGNASRLISAVCAELSPSEVFVICEDSLKEFYRKIGFELAGYKAILTAKK